MFRLVFSSPDVILITWIAHLLWVASPHQKELGNT